jgi:DNA polymerase III delta prime subunit
VRRRGAFEQASAAKRSLEEEDHARAITTTSVVIIISRASKMVVVRNPVVDPMTSALFVNEMKEEGFFWFARRFAKRRAE